MREKTMRGLMYSAIPIAAFAMVLLAWGMYQGTVRRTSTGVRIRIARDTCACSSSRVVVLHVLKDGDFQINLDDVRPGELGMRLNDIYATRAERIIYLAAEDDVPFERVAEASSIAQHYIDQIVVLTTGAMDTPCCEKGCYDFTYPYVVRVRESAGATESSDSNAKEMSKGRVPPCPQLPYLGPKLSVPAELR